VGQKRLVVCVFLICSWFGAQRAGADPLKVIVDKAPVFAAPNAGTKAIFYIGRGKALESNGKSQRGFYQLKTKSGRKVFIQAADVEAAGGSVESDLVSEEAVPNRQSFRRFRFDGGGSVGSSNRGSFYEINLGVSYYLLEWLVWRNAPFFRFQSSTPNSFGLDSSLRGQYSLPVAPEFSPSFMMGAGFRFINTGSHAPFAEFGLGLRVSGAQFQLGVKYIAGKLISDRVENEVIFNGGFTVSASM